MYQNDYLFRILLSSFDSIGAFFLKKDDKFKDVDIIIIQNSINYVNIIIFW